MQYVDFYDFNEDKVSKLLKSENPSDQLEGLLYTVLGGGDYKKSDKLIYHFIKSDQIVLRNTAFLCVSHLVRIHKKLDLLKYLPLLEEIILNQNQELIDYAEGSVEDIWIFHPEAKIFDFTSWASIHRFIKVFKVHKSAEESKSFQSGISALEKLKKGESNPSIMKAIDTSITLLNYMLED